MSTPWPSLEPAGTGTTPGAEALGTLARRGLSLGWRLGLATAILVTLVMGTLTYIQEKLKIRHDRSDRNELLTQFMTPLVANVEAASSLDQITDQFAVFREACLQNGYPDLQMVLKDGAGRTVATFVPGWEESSKRLVLHDSVPVFSSALPGGMGLLSAWRDDSRFQEEVAQRWGFWFIDIGVMIACILACLLVANHFLITRPLRQLLVGVRRMAKGDYRDLERMRGSWEWRWLAQRVRELGADLEETVRRLVEAERRALLYGSAIAGEEQGRVEPLLVGQEVPPGEVAAPRRKTIQHRLLHHYFMDKVRLLESQDQNDPVVRRYAQEVWDHDVAEADRVGEIVIRNRLDDAAFRILYPEEHRRVTTYLAAVSLAHARWFEDIEEALRKSMEERRLPRPVIQHRAKHAAGIWRKMQADGCSIEQVEDVFAFRIIFPDERHCFQALEAIHRRFEPKLLRFKDYITNPKPNGYQSIHTYLSDGAGMNFEVQIRTVRMQQQADEGSAAHWRYKAEQQDGLEGARPGGLWRRLRLSLHLVRLPAEAPAMTPEKPREAR